MYPCPKRQNAQVSVSTLVQRIKKGTILHQKYQSFIALMTVMGWETGINFCFCTYYCHSEHARGALEAECWSVKLLPHMWLCLQLSFRLLAPWRCSYDKSTETKEARNQVLNPFQALVHSCDWYFWRKPSTLLSSLKRIHAKKIVVKLRFKNFTPEAFFIYFLACIDVNWCVSGYG